MKRHNNGIGRRLSGRTGTARTVLVALLAALLVWQSGPMQAFAVVAEEAAEQRLIEDLTSEDPSPEAEDALRDALSEGGENPANLVRG